MQADDPDQDPRFLGTVNDLDGVEEGFDRTASSSGSDGTSAPSESLGAVAEEGMPGSGAAGSMEKESAGEPDILSRFSEEPASPRDFGSAEQGMPGDGSTGSFSADAFHGDGSGLGNGGAGDGRGADAQAGSGFIREENVGEQDSGSGFFEKPDSSRDFGSAEQGMPGDGSTGSFSADGFDGGPGGQGMPGDGSSGSFSADAFHGDGSGLGNGGAGDGRGAASPEPFSGQPDEDQIAALPKEEDALRLLPFRASNLLEDIHFAFDKHDLDNHSRAILKKNLDYLKSHPKLKIEIQGHCDERGSNSYNISLGERRVQSTKSYLVSLGVDANRIHTISYGEEKPFCTESSEECWYQNRRAHFLIGE